MLGDDDGGRGGGDGGSSDGDRCDNNFKYLYTYVVKCEHNAHSWVPKFCLFISSYA